MKTKTILKEWKNFLNQYLLLESRIDDIKEELVNSNPQKISEEDWNFYVNNPDDKIKHKLRKDTLFLDIVYNTLKEGRHSIYDIVSLFKDYTIHVLPQFSRGEELHVRVPGGRRIDLRSALEEKRASYDDLLNYLEAKKETKVNTKILVNCLKESNFSETSGNTAHFDVIVNQSSPDWVICYPRSIRGSIALSRSYWNGSRLVYDSTFNKEKEGSGKYTGTMTWCTSIDSENNMFLNYHRRLNLHMYYCIRKKTDVDKRDNKICLSFAKQGSNIMLQKGSATVNEYNENITEGDAINSLGDVYFDILKDVEKDDKLEISTKDYYKSITLSQFKTLAKANEENIKLFSREAKEILKYSIEGKEIAEYCIRHDNKELKKVVLTSEFPLDSELIREFLNKEKDKGVIEALIKNVNCPIDIMSKVIKKEQLFSLEDYNDHQYIEEIREIVCYNVINTNQYDQLDNEAKKSIKSVFEDLVESFPNSVVYNFYYRIEKDARKDKIIYKLFFTDFPFSSLDSDEKRLILKDNLFPEDILLIFFNEILTPATRWSAKRAADDLEYDYNLVINHSKLPVKLFKNIYDIAVQFKLDTDVFLELAKCKRSPNDLLRLLSNHEDSDVSKEADSNLRSNHPLVILLSGEVFTEEELIVMSAGRSQRQKIEIVKSKDLNRFSIETTRTVLRNIIKASLNDPRVMKFLSKRDDLVELGLELDDLKAIYSNLRFEFDKDSFAVLYPQVLQGQNLASESLLRKYIRNIL